MSFFIKLICFTMITSMLQAMPCPVASFVAKTPVERVQLAYLRANLSFPQVDTGTGLAILESAISNSLNPLKIIPELTPSWKQNVYQKMLRMHKKYRVIKEVSAEDAESIFTEHLGRIQGTYMTFIQTIAYNLGIPREKIELEIFDAESFDKGQIDRSEALKQIHEYNLKFAEIIKMALSDKELSAHALKFKNEISGKRTASAKIDERIKFAKKIISVLKEKALQKLKENKDPSYSDIIEFIDLEL
ncbi:MAG: hypothetical protein CL674_08710 [Bdellovibrionaceae bacterium]|nr:hypothetical protein [Pseudobdellovibrionaceae bacterium]